MQCLHSVKEVNKCIGVRQVWEKRIVWSKMKEKCTIKKICKEKEDGGDDVDDDGDDEEVEFSVCCVTDSYKWNDMVVMLFETPNIHNWL